MPPSGTQSIASRRRLQGRPREVARRGDQTPGRPGYLAAICLISGTVEGREAPLVLDHGISDPERGGPDVPGAVNPVGIVLRGRRRSDVRMQVAGVGVLDQPAIQHVGTLVRLDLGVRVDSEVQPVEVVDGIAHPGAHLVEEPAQSSPPPTLPRS